MQARKDVPQHAAEQVTARKQPQTEVLAGPLGGEALPEHGRVVHLVPLSRPLPSSGAMVRGLGKGHCDRPLVTQVRAEASLPMPLPASTRAAINNEATRQHQQILGHHGLNLATLDKIAPVVVVVCLLCGCGVVCGCCFGDDLMCV